MLELTIDGKVYCFNFGIGFVRDVNKREQQTMNGIKKDVGLQYAIAAIIDKDLLETVEILLLAHKGFAPRVSREQLDKYIDDPCTDIDALFTDLQDFFENPNATKQMYNNVQKLIAESKEKQAAK